MAKRNLNVVSSESHESPQKLLESFERELEELACTMENVAGTASLVVDYLESNGNGGAPVGAVYHIEGTLRRAQAHLNELCMKLGPLEKSFKQDGTEVLNG